MKKPHLEEDLLARAFLRPRVVSSTAFSLLGVTAMCMNYSKI